MRVGVSRIEYWVEVKSFGLEEREVLEVANRVLKKEWEKAEISEVERDCGYYRIYVEFYVGVVNFDGESFERLKEEVKKLGERIERALEVYKALKNVIEIYNSCNGNGKIGKEHIEILEKLGIPVIS